MSVVFKACALYNQTLVEKVRAYPVVAQKLKEFRDFKTANPVAQYGATDKPFHSTGNFTKAVAGIRHAHLTHDIMIVYTISGRNPTEFDLYGVFSHDELGIGQPANMKRQKSSAKRLANQTFQ